MSIASRISAMQEHLRDDYDVLDLAGADLTNVDKNILNLKPTWKERLLYFMNNGTQQVWNNWTKTTGTGTTLTLNNTEEAPMSLVYKGNTLQNGEPTPDNPVPIQVVSGDNSIVVEGKNLALNDNPTNPDANYQTSGTGSQPVLYDSTNEGYYTTTARLRKFNKLGTGTFTISLNWKVKEAGSPTIYVYKIDSTGTNANSLIGAFPTGTDIPTTYERISRTYTITEGYDGLQILLYNKIYWNDIMLEKGNQATTYEPYTGESYPISLGDIELLKIGTYQDKIDKSSGKNLFNLTATDFNNGSTLGSAKKVEITLEPNTQYTLSSNAPGTSSATNIWFNGNDSATYGVYNGTSKTTTTDSNGKLFIAIRTSEISNIFANNWIMLNEGTTALEYEPYGARWYVKKEIGKLNLSPIPFSAFNSGTTNTTRVVWYGLGRNYIDSTSDLCNILPFNINIWNVDTQGFSVGYSTGYIIVRINKSIIGSTEEEANTWLSNNDLIIYAPLVTPTYTLIEDTTLINQLETIKKSYEGQTNITQENNDMPFILDITALSK